MGKTYRYEMVDMTDYQLFHHSSTEIEKAGRQRLKRRLNALGMEGYKFICKYPDWMWFQKEIDE